MRAILLILLFLEILIADSISDNNALSEFLKSQGKIKFGVQQRACATCDWSISYPVSVDTINSPQNLDSINLGQNPQNLDSKTLAKLQNLKNIDHVLQYSAMQNLLDESGLSSDSFEMGQDSTNGEINENINYEFLGQKNGTNYLDGTLNAKIMESRLQDSKNAPLDSILNAQNAAQNPLNNPNIKLTKATFIKYDLSRAYAQILKHKGVLSCMYCGTLDKIAPQLPLDSKSIKQHNVNYSFYPQGSLYRIDISDSVCGVVDSLIFVSDKSATQLFVYSRTRCKG